MIRISTFVNRAVRWQLVSFRLSRPPDDDLVRIRESRLGILPNKIGSFLPIIVGKNWQILLVHSGNQKLDIL